MLTSGIYIDEERCARSSLPSGMGRSYERTPQLTFMNIAERVPQTVVALGGIFDEVETRLC